MHKSSYTFQVYSPIKGSILLILVIGICLLLIALTDQYGPVELKYSAWKNPVLYGIAGLLLHFFSKKAVSDVEIVLDVNGILINWFPNWRWGQTETRQIGWLELDRWIYKRGRSDGHSIWWDRLTFKLSDGTRVSLLPTDDFEKDDRFKFFLHHLNQAIQDYNNRSATQIPIHEGPEPQKILLGAWFTLFLSLIFFLFTILAMYITLEKGKGWSWWMLGCVVMLLAFGYQFWNRVNTIRKTLNYARDKSQ